jgi:uncharacterized CHY-type Zn-finger protein
MMMTMQQWYRASTNEQMVRCECWRHLLSVNEYGTWTAPNNGWFSEKDKYPHSDRCEKRER